jgi:hypothetical protein
VQQSPAKQPIIIRGRSIPPTAKPAPQSQQRPPAAPVKAPVIQQHPPAAPVKAPVIQQHPPAAPVKAQRESCRHRSHHPSA